VVDLADPEVSQCGSDAVRFPHQQPNVVTGAEKPSAGPRARPAPGRAALRALDAVRRGVDAIPDLLGRSDGVGSNSTARRGISGAIMNAWKKIRNVAAASTHSKTRAPLSGPASAFG